MERDTQETIKQGLPALPDPRVTLKEAAIFCWKNFWQFFALSISFFLVSVLVGLIFLVVVLFLHLGSALSATSFIVLILLDLFLGSFFAATFLFYVIKKANSEVVAFKESYKNGWKVFLPFLWASILFVLVVEGFGLLLVIPGLIFEVYLIFAPFAVIVDNRRGLDALFDSYAAVRGSWWMTFWYFFFPSLILLVVFIAFVFLCVALVMISSAAGLSLVGHIIVGVLFALMGVVFLLGMIGFVYPLMAAYTYFVYRNLKKRKAATFDAEFADIKAHRKTLFIVFAIIGLIVYAFISVQDYRNFSAGLKGGLFFQEIQNGLATTTLQAQPYVSTSGGFQINLPTGWALNDQANTSGTDDQFIFAFGPQIEGLNPQQVMVVSKSIEHDDLSSMGGNGLINNIIGTLQKKLTDFTLIGTSTEIINGKNANIFGGTFSAAGLGLSSESYVVIDGNYFYNITFTTSSDLWNQYEPLFDKTASTFQITGSSDVSSAAIPTNPSTVSTPSIKKTESTSNSLLTNNENDPTYTSSLTQLYTDNVGMGVDIELPAGWTHQPVDNIGNGVGEALVFSPPGQNPPAAIQFVESTDQAGLGTASDSDILNGLIQETQQSFTDFILLATSTGETTGDDPEATIQGTIVSDGTTLNIKGINVIFQLQDGSGYSYKLYLISTQEAYSQYEPLFDNITSSLTDI